MKKYTLVLFAILLAILSCERDDICPGTTPTTPHLIIRFYDQDEPESLKDVDDLVIQGIDNEIAYTFISSTDSIAIPLRTDMDQTTYILHKDYEIDEGEDPNDPNDDIILGNSDIITIDYIAEEIYVSRACGYKTIFNNVQATNNVDGTDTDEWIQQIILTQDPLTVDNETAAHIQILH